MKKGEPGPREAPKNPQHVVDPVRHGMSTDGGARANESLGEINSGFLDVGGRGPGGAFNSIGKARRRVDGRAKVTGQTLFADDIALPRMVWCRLLRGPIPFGRLTSVDVAAARAMPGVKLILTGADFPVSYGILPVSMDEHPLARDLVRHVGDPVAAVVAETEDQCEAALRALRVEYEQYPTISDSREALATSEPRIHDYGSFGNVHKTVHMDFGDADQGFAEADEIFEDVFFFQGNTHLPLEQHSTIASIEGNDVLTVRSSTQTPHYLHKAVARALEVPASRV